MLAGEIAALREMVEELTARSGKGNNKRNALLRAIGVEGAGRSDRRRTGARRRRARRPAVEAAATTRCRELSKLPAEWPVDSEARARRARRPERRRQDDDGGEARGPRPDAGQVGHADRVRLLPRRRGRAARPLRRAHGRRVRDRADPGPAPCERRRRSHGLRHHRHLRQGADAGRRGECARAAPRRQAARPRPPRPALRPRFRARRRRLAHREALRASSRRPRSRRRSSTRPRRPRASSTRAGRPGCPTRSSASASASRRTLLRRPGALLAATSSPSGSPRGKGGRSMSLEHGRADVGPGYQPGTLAVVAEAEHRAQKTLDRAAYGKYLPLVRRTAMRLARRVPSTISVGDLVGYGWIGLMEAFQRSDPSMPAEEFEAYALYRVRGAMLDYLRSLDPTTRETRRASRRITETIRALSTKLGRDATEQEIAEAMGLGIDAYRALLEKVGAAGMARLELLDLDDLERRVGERSRRQRGRQAAPGRRGRLGDGAAPAAPLAGARALLPGGVHAPSDRHGPRRERVARLAAPHRGDSPPARGGGRRITWATGSTSR